MKKRKNKKSRWKTHGLDHVLPLDFGHIYGQSCNTPGCCNNHGDTTANSDFLNSDVLDAEFQIEENPVEDALSEDKTN